MASKKDPSIQQSAIGDGNVQIAGDDNVVHQEVTNYIPDDNQVEPDLAPPAAQTTQSIVGDGNIQVLGNHNIIQKFITSIRLNAELMREMRNRRVMLDHVNNFWVKGILEKSLYDTALLDLGMKEDPQALKYPWKIKREVNQELLPAGMSMLEVFQEIGLGRSLLVLGEPGSGKTTMLLELARQAMERSSKDMIEPVPVVFNLSSWTENLSLADWLIRELNTFYYLPKVAATSWVNDNKMFLLLDGLDEVRQPIRGRCVEAINRFRQGHGPAGIAVCCRIQDYSELQTRLSFDGAVEILPLTTDQIEDYFKKSGSSLKGVRQALERDTALREMAQTPLFLSIMSLAYKNEKGSNISLSDDPHLQRKMLFDAYIERMFVRPARNISSEYQKYEVLRWLAWLASKMSKFNQSTYLIEGMQPEWLDDENHQKSNRRIRGLAIALIVSAVLGRLAWIPLGMEATAVVSGFLFLLIWALGAAITSSEGQIHTVDILKWNGAEILQSIVFGPVIGIVSIMVLNLAAWLLIWLADVLLPWQILDWETIRFSDIFWFGMVGGLGAGGLFALAFMLMFGVSSKDASLIKRPGERLFLTARNSLFLASISGSMVGGMIHGIGLLLILIDPTLAASEKNGFALSYGLVIGVIVGALYGGIPLILHYSLRLSMNLNRLTPWRLVRFLNHCVDLIFLRRVGGGYIFVHRLLMEHFASMYGKQK